MKKNLFQFQNILSLQKFTIMYSINVHPVTNNHVADLAKHWRCKDMTQTIPLKNWQIYTKTTI